MHRLGRLDERVLTSSTFFSSDRVNVFQQTRRRPLDRDTLVCKLLL